jgi:hypothetical protein
MNLLISGSDWNPSLIVRWLDGPRRLISGEVNGDALGLSPAADPPPILPAICC